MCFTADFSMCGSALSIICWQSFSSKKEEISTTSGCRLPELSQILEVTHCTRTEKSIFQEVSKKMYVYINILYIYMTQAYLDNTLLLCTHLKFGCFFLLFVIPFWAKKRVSICSFIGGASVSLGSRELPVVGWYLALLYQGLKNLKPSS